MVHIAEWSQVRTYSEKIDGKDDGNARPWSVEQYDVGKQAALFSGEERTNRDQMDTGEQCSR